MLEPWFKYEQSDSRVYTLCLYVLLPNSSLVKLNSVLLLSVLGKLNELKTNNHVDYTSFKFMTWHSPESLLYFLSQLVHLLIISHLISDFCCHFSNGLFLISLRKWKQSEENFHIFLTPQLLTFLHRDPCILPDLPHGWMPICLFKSSSSIGSHSFIFSRISLFQIYPLFCINFSTLVNHFPSVYRFCNVVPQLLNRVWLFAAPWTAAHLVFLSFTVSQGLLKLMSIEWVRPSNNLTLCHLLLSPSIFPGIRVFSNESALHIRWPKSWSFSFSNSPSNEQSGLISFRIEWFDLLALQGTLKSLF